MRQEIRLLVHEEASAGFRILANSKFEVSSISNHFLLYGLHRLSTARGNLNNNSFTSFTLLVYTFTRRRFYALHFTTLLRILYIHIIRCNKL